MNRKRTITYNEQKRNKRVNVNDIDKRARGALLEKALKRF